MCAHALQRESRGHPRGDCPLPRATLLSADDGKGKRRSDCYTDAITCLKNRCVPSPGIHPSLSELREGVNQIRAGNEWLALAP